MFFVFKFEFLKSLISLGFNSFQFSLYFSLNFDFIINVSYTTSLFKKVISSNIEAAITLDFFLEKCIIELGNNMLALYFFKLFCNFFTKCKTFLFFTHLLVNQSHVFMSSFLLCLFCHSKNFSIIFSNMFNEASTIPNQFTFNCVD